MGVMDSEKIREAILNKARAEAQEIITDAEFKAKEIIEKAKKQRERKIEEEKNRMMSEARGEASKILAQASLKARQETLKEKAAIINKIINRVKSELLQDTIDKKPFLSLIKETVDVLETNKEVRIYVSSKDIGIAQEIIRVNKELKDRIIEVKELDCLGGVLAEDIEGVVSIDNTFETRLDMLMPKILPEIGKEIFGA
jgi:V/A-type H+-transporting ATPase subunit E